MALVADGSRICDSNRVALAGIDANFTLANKTDPIIYAGGVDLAQGDRAQDTHSWFWRRVGGTFAAVAATGEVKFGAATVLVNNTVLTNANKRTTQTATSVAIFVEMEGSSSQANNRVENQQSSESQIALSVANAIDNQQYEMMLRVVHDAGTTDITFLAKFSTPAGGTTFSQTLAAVSIGVVVLSLLKTFVKIITATSLGISVLTRVATYPRSLPATAIGVAGLAKGMFVALSTTSIGIAVLSPAKFFVRTLAAVAVGVASLSTIRVFVKTLAATAVGVAAFVKGMFVGVAATAIGVPAQLKGMFKSLLAVAVGVAALTRVITFVRALAATAVGVASLAAAQLRLVVMAAISVGVAVFADAVTFANTLAAAAAAASVFSRVATYARIFAASAVGITALTRGRFLTMTATVVSTAVLVRGMTKTLLATAIGTPTRVIVLFSSVNAAAVAAGTATLNKATIFSRSLLALSVSVAVLTTQILGGLSMKFRGFLSAKVAGARNLLGVLTTECVGLAHVQQDNEGK